MTEKYSDPKSEGTMDERISSYVKPTWDVDKSDNRRAKPEELTEISSGADEKGAGEGATVLKARELRTVKELAPLLDRALKADHRTLHTV